MKANLSGTVRIIALISSIALIAVLFLPLWVIDLTAPQYPEGLKLIIYANKLGGNVEVVNGLNHYIGMRTLHEHDFPEFSILPYLIEFFVIFGLIVVLVKKRWFYYLWVAFYLVFAFVSMLDFYRWEYDYGHNLDPTAPIQVPGMSYQPPLIGFKQLLNFGVYSIPDSGGWIFIAVALAIVVGAWLEWRKSKKNSSNIMMASLMIGSLLIFSSCNRGPQPIQVGRDNCEFCRMTISDSKFGAEIITVKGKIYKFDDFNCLQGFYKSGIIHQADIKSIFLVDYESPNELVNVEKTFLLQGGEIHSPMGSNLAAFSAKNKSDEMAVSMKAETKSWKEIWQY